MMILVIYGSGGMGTELYEMAIRRNVISHLWDEIMFCDDFREEGKFLDTESHPFEYFKGRQKSVQFIVAVGEPSAREKLYKQILASGFEVTSVIDPKASISPTAKIGKGCIISEFSLIHFNVSIGDNVLLQPFCGLGHNVIVESHSVVSGHSLVAGNVSIGLRTFLGINSSIKEKVKIGDDVIIAMGSSVFSDLPNNSVVVGNPARITKGNLQHSVFR